jgi:magnesium chelatase family protein
VTSSAEARARVVDARGRQLHRAGVCNAHLTTADLRDHAALDGAGARMLSAAYEAGRITARGHDRVLRVARTVADLARRDRVLAQDVAMALGLRNDDTAVDEAA